MLTAIRRNRTRGRMAQEIAMPLTFKAVDDSVRLYLYLDTNVSRECVDYVEYSLDSGKTWVRTNNIDNEFVSIYIQLQQNESVSFRGLANRYCNPNTGTNYYSQFALEGRGYVETSGNIMSLLNPNFKDLKTLNSYAFANLFYGCNRMKSAPLLPATTLANNCYYSMFSGCTRITQPPVLPATRLADACYSRMFVSTGLLTAPELPAVEMVNNCYYYMFGTCRSLTTPPALPAMTLAESCYEGMFYDCQGLLTAPVLPAIILALSCYKGMFQNCRAITKSPILSATVVVDNAYKEMFYGCQSLNDITMLGETIGNQSLSAWVYGVAVTGVFKKSPNATLPTGYNGIPENWTVENYNE